VRPTDPEFRRLWGKYRLRRRRERNAIPVGRLELEVRWVLFGESLPIGSDLSRLEQFQLRRLLLAERLHHLHDLHALGSGKSHRATTAPASMIEAGAAFVR
jgi:hypothetical protein